MSIVQSWVFHPDIQPQPRGAVQGGDPFCLHGTWSVAARHDCSGTGRMLPRALGSARG